MPSCSICRHPERIAIDAAVHDTSLRTVAVRYGVSKSSIVRHRQRCGGAPVDRPPMDQTGQQEPALVPPVNPLARCHTEAQALYARACLTPVWQAHLLLKDLAALLVNR